MPLHQHISRRQFIAAAGQATLASAALVHAGHRSSGANIIGANDRIRLAVCGVRKRGFDHVLLFSEIPNVAVAAICDKDESVIGDSEGNKLLREADRGYRKGFRITKDF